MKRLSMCGAAAMMAVSMAGVQAQTTPPQSPTQTPPAQSASQDPAKQTATLRGCVYNEKDVPGRAPNVAEKAGVLEDYIFVPQSDTAMTGTAGTTGTSGSAAGAAGVTTTTHKAFKLEKAPDEQLRAMVGKMVEVSGKIDAEAGDASRSASTGSSTVDRTVGMDKVNLPEFEVSSIKEVTGTCPATPEIKK